MGAVFWLPLQSPHMPEEWVSLTVLDAIFAPMEEACTLLTAGPSARDTVSSMAASRRTTSNSMALFIAIRELVR